MLPSNQKKIVIGHQAQHQIVFAGSFGVGKSTALRSVSDIEVVNTDVKSLELTDELRQAGKTTTTVALDYGELNLPGNMKVALFGLPGQQRFDDMWRTLLHEDAGVILWLFGNKQNALAECQQWLETLKQRNATKKLAVALTRVPVPTPTEILTPFRKLVAQYNPYSPVVVADPRNKMQVQQTILMAVGTPTFES